MAMTACFAKFVTSSILSVAERSHLLAVDGNGADQLVFLQHRNRGEGAGASELQLVSGSAWASVTWDSLLRRHQPSEPSPGKGTKHGGAPPGLRKSRGAFVLSATANRSKTRPP